jgi:superfamily I DNA/RNA helicase
VEHLLAFVGDKMKILFTGSPGTGKTFSMIKTIKEMLENKEIETFKIIAPTRVSSEAVMNAMIANEIFDENAVSTIHSFCFRKQERKPVWTEDNDEIFYRKYNLKFIPGLGIVDFIYMPIGNKIDYVRRKIINETNMKVNELKNNKALELIVKFSREAQLTIKEEIVYKILIDREQTKEFQDMIDFDDMVLNASSDVDEYDLIAVDESQTAPKFVLEYIRKIMKTKHFFSTCDPTQAINPLSANLDYLIDFIKKFDKVEILKENKRMAENIVNYVNKVYSRIKPIWENTYSNIKGGEVRIVDLGNLNYVLDKADILITFSNDAIKRISSYLIEAGVPFLIRSGLEKIERGIWDEEKLKLRDALINFINRKCSFDELNIINRYAGLNLGTLELNKLYNYSFDDIMARIKAKHSLFGYALERAVHTGRKPIIVSTVHSSQGLTFDSVLVYPKITSYLKRTFNTYSATTWYGVAITREKNKLFILNTSDSFIL